MTVAVLEIQTSTVPYSLTVAVPLIKAVNVPVIKAVDVPDDLTDAAPVVWTIVLSDILTFAFWDTLTVAV